MVAANALLGRRHPLVEIAAHPTALNVPEDNAMPCFKKLIELLPKVPRAGYGITSKTSSASPLLSILDICAVYPDRMQFYTAVRGWLGGRWMLHFTPPRSSVSHMTRLPDSGLYYHSPPNS